MTQFAIINSDPIASLTFDEIQTIDISTFAGTDYISLALPEFAKTSYTLSATFIDFTSNENGNFGVGPTDSLPFSGGTFVNTQTNNDTELRFPISQLTTIDKSKITGVRFRLTTTAETTFRCLAIRACASNWKYSPVDLNTLWNRVTRPPAPNGSINPLRTNLFLNPSAETNTTGWGIGATSWAESSITRSENTEIPLGTGRYAIHATGKKDATTTGRTFSVVLTTPVGTVTPGKTYSAAAQLYIIDNLAQGLAIRYDWYTSASAYISSSTPSSPTVTSTGLVTLKTTAEAPATASLVTVVVYGNSIISGEIIDLWADSWMLEQASTTGTYFDGSYGGAEWSGTANASTSNLYSLFPAEEGVSFPAVFRSNLVNGMTDPEPVNLTIGSAFTAGSFTKAKGAKKNELALYFRDVPTDNQTMIEVDTKKMADLEILGKQPDFGRALFNSRAQEEIDLYDQTELDERSQFNLERKRDESEHTWMEVRLKWGEETATNQLTIYDADGRGYKWTGMALEASTTSDLDKGRYILIASIKNQEMRAEIYKLNQIGEFVSTEPVFDTGKVKDDDLIKRRKGRFGWQANLLDGDAYISNIKTRGTNFGEMISKEYRSVTPVKGVQIYAGSTSEKELISGFEQTNSEFTNLTLDPNASPGGKAVRVDVTPLKPLQGIMSNAFYLDDPTNIRISFDIKFPSSEVAGGGLSVYLLGDYQAIYPLNVSNFTLDTWTHVKCSLPNGKYQTGSYRVLLIQSLPVVATSWWVENLSAKTYTVKWSARPHKSNAWNEESSRWLEAGFTLNSLNGGVVFPEHGNGLQLRAQALRQDAVISDFKAIPQYATLGRFVFKDSIRNYTTTKETVSKLTLTASQSGASTPNKEVAWTTIEGIKAEGGAVAACTPGTGNKTTWLWATNFELGVPSTALVTGVKATIKRTGTGLGITERKLYLFTNPTIGATVGSNKATPGFEWGATTVATYGGIEDTWGTTLSPELVNSSTFGVGIQLNGASSSVAEIDYIKLLVAYKLPT